MGITEARRGPSGRILPGTQLPVDEILSRLRQLFETTDVVLLAYLFGSLAKGKPGQSSDVDIAVLLRMDIPVASLYDVYRDLYVRIYEILASERFDLVLLNQAPLTLKFTIVSEGKLIYACCEEILNEFELNVIREYQDTAYLRAVQDYFLRERARQWCSE